MRQRRPPAWSRAALSWITGASAISAGCSAIPARRTAGERAAPALCHLSGGAGTDVLPGLNGDNIDYVTAAILDVTTAGR